MIHAAGVGVTLTLLGADPEDRDPALLGATREAVLAAVTTDGADEAATPKDGGGRAAARAVALKAVLPEAGAKLTTGERAVLVKWLDRLIHPARRPAARPR